MYRVTAIGFKDVWQSRRSILVLCLLFAISVVVICLLLAMNEALRKINKAHLTTGGFNRLTLSSDTRPLSMEDLTSIEQVVPRARVIPQLSTIVTLTDPEGVERAFLATSCVPSDPLLAATPMVSGVDGDDQGIVLSPSCLSRFQRDEYPSYLTTTLIEGKDGFARPMKLEVVGVAASNGGCGIRIGLQQMIRVRLSQIGIEDMGSIEEGLHKVEINEIHVMLGSDDDIDAVQDRLSELGNYRFTSPYHEMGKERDFVASAVGLGWPFGLAIFVANSVIILLVVLQLIEADKAKLNWLQLNGCDNRTFWHWYVVPRIASCFGFCVVAVLTFNWLVCVFDQSSVQESFGIEILEQVPLVPVLTVTLIAIGFVVSTPAQFAFAKKEIMG